MKILIIDEEAGDFPTELNYPDEITEPFFGFLTELEMLMDKKEHEGNFNKAFEMAMEKSINKNKPPSRRVEHHEEPTNN